MTPAARVGLRTNGRTWAYTIRHHGGRVVSPMTYRTCTDALAAGHRHANPGGHR